MNLPRIPFFRQATTVVLAAVLAACGGGDGNGSGTTPATQTLGGTAAVGAPIVGGGIAITCAGGAGLSATTSSTGTWTVDVSGQTLPCAVQVSGGTVGGTASTLKLHSVALAFDGTVNLTPLTDLAVARLVTGDPAAWFAKPVFTGIDAAAVAAAVKSLATSLGLADALGTTDPFTATFDAKAGDAVDDLLEALKAALGALSKTYAALLTAAAAGDFTAFSGFPAAIEVALGGGGSGGTCTAGTAMVYALGQPGAGFSDGQTVCFEATATTLKFQGKTLTDPVKIDAVTAPYAGYTFTDGDVKFEVILNAGALYEINVLAPTFVGQFTPPSATKTLAVDVQVGGLTTATIEVGAVPVPGSEAEFCGAIDTDATFASIGTTAGGTLTIKSCSFSAGNGVVEATLSAGGATVDYTVIYRYF